LLAARERTGIQPQPDSLGNPGICHRLIIREGEMADFEYDRARAASTVKVGRLAMRHEGAFWNAYYALPGTMNGAVMLGGVAMRFITNNEPRKTAFVSLMLDAVADLIEEQTGHRPTWPEGPTPAPESERAGHA
jgi:hypothetical protein